MNLLRSSLKSLLPIRGPKVVKQENIKASNNIINIYKEKKDPEIKSYKHYPFWLYRMVLDKLPSREKHTTLFTDIGETVMFKEEDYKKIIKHQRKQDLKQKNMMKKDKKSIRNIEDDITYPDDLPEIPDDGGLFIDSKESATKKADDNNSGAEAEEGDDVDPDAY